MIFLCIYQSLALHQGNAQQGTNCHVSYSPQPNSPTRQVLPKPIAFLQNQEGVSAIQFALLAPIFIFAMIAALQLGIVMIIENALEGAAREASRFAIVDANLDRESAIRNHVKDTASDLSGGIVKKDNVLISVKAYDKISDLGRPEPFTDLNGNGEYDVGETYVDTNGNGQWDADQGVSGSFGEPGAAVIYEISYVYDTIIPIFNFNRFYTVTAKTIVVNEDFDIR